MMTKRNETEELAALLEQTAAELRLRPRQRNWIDQFRGGEALPLSRAAEVAGADAETYRGWHGAPRTKLLLTQKNASAATT
jgi:hypothetical protein